MAHSLATDCQACARTIAGVFLYKETNMKKLENKCMLITYSDSMGSNLKDLNNVLDKHFKDAIGGVHILPFFPSSGDRGFAPMDYHKVDSAFGDWTDIEKLADKYYLMFDYMINHISAHSEYYKDFLEKKDKSQYADLFIRYKDFWENGEPTPEQVDACLLYTSDAADE